MEQNAEYIKSKNKRKIVHILKIHFDLSNTEEKKPKTYICNFFFFPKSKGVQMHNLATK